MDIRGFDSSIILILRVGILVSKGNFPEILRQQILVGLILVGRLGLSMGGIPAWKDYLDFDGWDS